MLEIIAFLILGSIAGVLTGLIPGLHVNNVILVLISLLPFLSSHFEVYSVAAFIVSMALVHSFVDFIPSVLIGAPEEENSLSVLPGHRLLMEGRGYEAVRLTAIGGLYSLILSLAFMPVIFFVIPEIYPVLRLYMPFILALIIIYLISQEGKNWTKALLVFLLSGALGLMALNNPSLSSEKVIFPIFAGLFGISTIAMSIRTSTEVVGQSLSYEEGTYARAGFAGFIAGLIAGFLPGIGSAQSALLTKGLFNRDSRSFLVAHGGVNTGAAVFSILALYLIGNPRSGASIGLRRLFPNFTFENFLFIILFFMISCFFAIIATLTISKIAVMKIGDFNYRWISVFVVSFMLILISILSGITGIAIAFLATSIGIFTGLSGVKKSHCMGVLIVPTLVYYILL